MPALKKEKREFSGEISTVVRVQIPPVHQTSFSLNIFVRFTDYDVMGQTLSSSYERGRKAEEIAKEWLQKKFNVSFSRKNLQVGLRSDGKPAMHNFDFVSEDNQMVAEVKSHQLTKSGNPPSGKISDTYKACFMLEKASARKKLLILTNPKFYEIFKRYSDGKISKEIEIVPLADGSVSNESSGVRVVSLQSKSEKPKKTDFDIFWTKLISWLSHRQHIINWTVKSGEIGEDFEAVHGGGNYIIIYPKSAGVQKVPKNDFRIIYENWNGYVAEAIPRSHFVHGPISKSRFTKYVISIIHQYTNYKRKI